MRKINVIFWVLFGGLIFIQGSLRALRKMIVTVPVADLRRDYNVLAEPGLHAPALSKNVRGLDTQLLYNERVLALDEQPDAPNMGWLKVIAVEQETCDRSSNHWHGYPGYVRKEHVRLEKSSDSTSENRLMHDLFACKPWVPVYRAPSVNSRVVKEFSIGTRLMGHRIKSKWYKIVLPGNRKGYVREQDTRRFEQNRLETKRTLRHKLVKTVLSLVGTPYVFGGRSAYNRHMTQLTGLDCSSLVDLVHRVYGIKTPRDAHDQFLKAREIRDGKNLKAGDLLFFSRKPEQENGRMNHVVIYLGNGDVCEATGLDFTSKYETDRPETLTTRVISVKEFIGSSINDITSGDQCSGVKPGYFVYLRTFLK